MSIVVPKERKHLSADALFRLVRSGLAQIPDYRPDEVDISLVARCRNIHRVRHA